MAETMTIATASRWDLIKALCNRGPVSINEAAQRVGGDVETVRQDVAALLNVGVLRVANDGKVEFPFDTLRVEFVLKAA
jgi:predicted transcriptional regulator